MILKNKKQLIREKFNLKNLTFGTNCNILNLLKELSAIYNAYNKNAIIIATKKASDSHCIRGTKKSGDSHQKEELKKAVIPTKKRN